jgi:peptidoglycan-associated lipoprotein
MQRLVLALTIAPMLFATSCASEEKKEDAPPTQANNAAEEKPAAEAPKKELPPEIQKLVANFQRVHFEFNSSDINNETQEALKENAEIMKSRPDVKVEVQGHADERGTNEYNLALGDKRANAVKDYLVRSGIEAARVATVSYGEEKPLVEGQTEQSWSKNRRVEFRVTWGEGEAVGTTH